MDAALYAALNVASVVGAGKATGVHRFRAPLTANLPVVVFGLMDSEDAYVMPGRAFVRMNYMIKVIEAGLSASTAATLADTIDSLITNVALTVTGYTLMVGRRVRLIGYIEDADSETYQHVGGEYEFMLDPT